MINTKEYDTYGQEYHGDEIAVVGIALRVPGANDVDTFWNLLKQGLNPFETVTEADLEAAGIDPGVYQSPSYVKRSTSMNNIKAFDPGFFGFSALDAALMDPQYRHFLELCWEVFEHAGEQVDSIEGSVGIFAGSGQNGYLLHHLAANSKLVQEHGHWYLRHVGNDKDFMTTRASYHLNLKGPSVNIQTACSTSLVASHLACQSLISRECDMAVAGGITIAFPHGAGYIAHEGGIEDPRGECRSYDTSSQGTVFSSGGAVILLKRLEDALQEKNTIYGVIRASGVNNDGSTKASFTAPSVDGQVSVILETLDLGEVDPETIGYVEGHGTGTPIGDPIEVEAMTTAWRTHTRKKQFAALSSAKSNVGHMDTASGVVSIIKALGCLYQGYKYPTAHYSKPNAALNIEASPFYVSNTLEQWHSPNQLRRACASALGVGGTNCHIILEEAPRKKLNINESNASQPDQGFVLPFSAKTPSALLRYQQHLKQYFLELQKCPIEAQASLADIAHTLVNGRCHFQHRAVFQASTIDDAVASLGGLKPGSIAHTEACKTPPQKVAFAFTGQGTQYFNMGLGLYQTNETYRDTFDHCATVLLPIFGHDIRTIVFNDTPTKEDQAFLDRIDVTHPILFSMAYAMAKAWIQLGYVPDALIGHSLGEYVAATIAGVFKLPEVLALVCKRGKLMHSTPTGVMLSIIADEADLLPYLEHEDLKDKLSIAGVNVQGMTVISGEPVAGRVLMDRLEATHISCKALRIPRASHCVMMDSILEPYEEAVSQCELSNPSIPIVSNIDGQWLTNKAATSPSYWRQHLRSAVRFADGTRTLMQDPQGYLFIEIGPGSQLTRLIERHPSKGHNHQAVSTMPGPADEEDSGHWFKLAPARIWSAGGQYDWSTQNSLGSGFKLPLPTYPWDHQQYWYDLPTQQLQLNSTVSDLYRQELKDWFYLPSWQQTLPVQHAPFAKVHDSIAKALALIVVDAISKDIEDLLAHCAEHNLDVVIAIRSDTNAIIQQGQQYLISGLEASGYTWLLEQLSKDHPTLDQTLQYVIQWIEPEKNPTAVKSKSKVQQYFQQNLYLSQALAEHEWHQLIVNISGYGFLGVSPHELDDPAKILAFSPFRTLAAERDHIHFVAIDIQKSQHIKCIVPELQAYTQLNQRHAIPIDEIAHRNNERFTRHYAQVQIEARHQTIRLRDKGIYVFVGLGDLAISAANSLIDKHSITPIFVSRSALPPQEQWQTRTQSSKVDKDTTRIRQLLEMQTKAPSLEVYQADASKAQQMSVVFNEIKQTHGTIHGIFHAAGILDDQLLPLKSIESAERVLAPKVYGLDAYEELLETESLDFLALYSSVSSLLGVAGQVDYSAANAYLAAYARYQNQNLNRPVIALHWGVWSDAGMATAEAKRQGISDSKQDFSVNIFDITSWLASKELGPIQLCQGTLESASSWVLQDHQTRDGQYIYPGSGYVDSISSVYKNIEGVDAFEIHDLLFQSPYMVNSNSVRQVGVTLTPPDEKLTRDCQFMSWHDDALVIHASCRIVPLNRTPRSAKLADVMASLASYESIHHDKTEHSYMAFGPRWQTLQMVTQGNSEALLELRLKQEYLTDLEQHPFHPGLLDIAIGGQFLIPNNSDCSDFYVPLSYGKMSMFGDLQPQILSHCRYRAALSTPEIPVFDYTIYNKTGDILVEVEGFHLKKVDANALDGVALPSMHQDQGTPCPIVLAAQNPNSLFEKILQHGINSVDGAQALLRVLNLTQLPPQIIISSMPFDRYCAAVNTTQSNQTDAPHTENLMMRPAISTAYQPLSNDIEFGIGAIWEQALGIKDIGKNDGFFELGGHSLLLIQMIAKLKSTFPVKINMAALFEVTTIAQWALLLAGDLGQAKTQSTTSTEDTTTADVARHLSSLPPVEAHTNPLQEDNDQISEDNQSTSFSALKNITIGIVSGLMGKNVPHREPQTYPATYSQKALHFLQQFQPTSVPYSIPFEYWFDDEINPELLQQALNIVVARHDILRTVYKSFESELNQVVLADLPITVNLVDAIGETEAEIHQRIYELTQTPFDLAIGPLLQSTLFKVSERRWALYICFHHISFDHLAILQIAKELDQVYSRLLISPEMVSCIPPRIQMRDYALWQAQYQSADYLRKKMDYWINNIPDPGIYLDLPTDYPRPVMSQAKGAELIIQFPELTAQSIRATAKQLQVSRYLLTMTIYASLLHCYTGAPKVILGTPFANRGDQEELQVSIGCFMNTLPMVFDFEDSPSLATLLERTQTSFLEVFRNQDVAFELIIETLKPPRNTSHHPLFQVAFMYQDPPMEISLGGTKADNRYLHNGSSKFDMTLWLWDRGDGIEASIEYSTELYTEKSIKGFLDVYFYLVNTMTADPHKALNDIRLVHQNHVADAALMGSTTPLEADSIPDMFLKNMQSRLDIAQGSDQLCAVESDSGSLTYEQLQVQMNNVTSHLLSSGISSGDLVGIYMDRSASLLPILLGVMNSGAAYVPLDPDYPQDRLIYMIEHSTMKCIVADSALETQIQALIQPMQNKSPRIVQTEACLASNTASHSAPPTIAPTQTAYVIYTSGSTGRPKGVSVPHQAAVNFLTSMQQKPGFTAQDKLMAVTTLSFDISVLELFLPIMSGGTVDVVPFAISRDGFALIQRIKRIQPTVMQATPATWRLLLIAGLNDQLKPLKSLVGGEALPQDLVKDLLPCVSELWNMYGPTETTVWSTCYQVEDPSAPIEIGAPIANTQCYVLDQHHRLLPAGVPGELFIGGIGVSQGYIHQDELTEERFIDHPIFPGPLYKTGDRVTRMPSGFLRYHSRLDLQVKVRGYRIELGEIEQQLLQFSEIASGAVISDGQHITAFYVLAPGERLSRLKVRKHLSSVLPKHMLPDFYVPLDELPLTPAGKTDRKKLAAIEVNTTGETSEQKPSTDSEHYYAKLWSKLLNRSEDSIGIHDNFFDIGGHSLLSLQVVAQAKKEYQIEMPAASLVLNTLGQLASLYPITSNQPKKILPPLKDLAEAVSNIQPSTDAPTSISQKLGHWWKSFRKT